MDDIERTTAKLKNAIQMFNHAPLVSMAEDITIGQSIVLNGIPAIPLESGSIRAILEVDNEIAYIWIVIDNKYIIPLKFEYLYNDKEEVTIRKNEFLKRSIEELMEYINSEGDYSYIIEER